MTGIPKIKPAGSAPMPATVAKTGYRVRNIKAASGYQWGGLLLMFLGFVPFFFGVPFLVGLALLIVGSIKARGYICGVCGNGVAETSTLCPTCHARLSAEPTLPWGWMTLGLISVLVIGFAYMRPDLARELLDFAKATVKRM